MIYLDHAATTIPNAATIQAMHETITTYFGNPSSLHDAGIAARKRLNEARRNIATLLGTTKNNILFTSTATEAINTVIKGTYFKEPQKTILTSTVEHHATINACKFVESRGGSILTLPSDTEGHVQMTALEDALKTHDVSLVSLIYANNEIGTITDVKSVNALCKKHGAKLHLDMVQGPAHHRIALDELNIDFASFAAHKFFGPRGVGILYQNHPDTLERLIHGGRHEFNHRAGTENLAGIVGCEHALKRCHNNVECWENTIKKNAASFIAALKAQGIDFRINGPAHTDKRLPSILNLGFKDQDAQIMAFKLNDAGICVSIGSACHSDVIETSHVLRSIGVPDDYIEGSLRFSLSHEEDEPALQTVATTIASMIKRGECKK